MEAIVAARRIRPGQKIVEYTGEKITNDEADRRYDEDKMKRHHTFLFTLDDDYCIDGDVPRNRAKLINHSCDPNCEAIIEDDRIFIYEGPHPAWPEDQLHRWYCAEVAGLNFNTNVLGNEFFTQLNTNFNNGAAAAVVVMLMVAVIPVMFYQVRHFKAEEANA